MPTPMGEIFIPVFPRAIDLAVITISPLASPPKSYTYSLFPADNNKVLELAI
jgi:hypothetical protein